MFYFVDGFMGVCCVNINAVVVQKKKNTRSLLLFN